MPLLTPSSILQRVTGLEPASSQQLKIEGHAHSWIAAATTTAVTRRNNNLIFAVNTLLPGALDYWYTAYYKCYANIAPRNSWREMGQWARGGMMSGGRDIYCGI
ncbi:hypothetical protein BDP27DRAFT_1370449 [Rhodocollybia butyracea]|uniref:Uncharacterized protein n=1 Tax=Rhodocollybia butyracea TaxID=206335 RepID=A0A9P5PAY7_9AGAR|nr:hypothetical protein BDP27DRAFT_1370449 [Rhodocollybia butyracea]